MRPIVDCPGFHFVLEGGLFLLMQGLLQPGGQRAMLGLRKHLVVKRAILFPRRAAQ